MGMKVYNYTAPERFNSVISNVADTFGMSKSELIRNAFDYIKFLEYYIKHYTKENGAVPPPDVRLKKDTIERIVEWL